MSFTLLLFTRSLLNETEEREAEKKQKDLCNSLFGCFFVICVKACRKHEQHGLHSQGGLRKKLAGSARLLWKLLSFMIQMLCSLHCTVWQAQGLHRTRPVVLPENLMRKVVFLLSREPRRRESRRLQRLFQPHREEGEAVLVQTEQHFCKLVHQTPRRPAPDSLETAEEAFYIGDLIMAKEEEDFGV